MTQTSRPVFYLIYLWCIFTPLFEWHVWAQQPDLTFDPLSVQSILNTDIDPGTISLQDIETLQTFQASQLISTNDLHSFFESTFNANGIYGEQKDGSSVQWEHFKQSIDSHFGTDVSILWLSKQYQDWYESIEATKKNLLAGGDIAEQELEKLFETTTEYSSTWTKQDWEDFATSKGLLGLGIILMSLFTLWKAKKDEQDPLEEAGSDIQQLLRTHDAENKGYRTFYWDIRREVNVQQEKKRSEALKNSSLEKPIEPPSFENRFNDLFTGSHNISIETLITNAQKNNEVINKQWYESMAQKIYKTSLVKGYTSSYERGRYKALASKIIEEMLKKYAYKMRYRGSRHPYLFYKYWIRPQRNQILKQYETSLQTGVSTKYAQYQSQVQQYKTSLSAFNEKKQSLFTSLPNTFQNWSRYAKEHWNHIHNKVRRTNRINHSVSSIQKKLKQQNQQKTRLNPDTVHSFLNAEWLKKNKNDLSKKDLNNPEWILETIHRHKELQQQIKKYKEDLASYGRGYGAAMTLYKRYSKMRLYTQAYYDKQKLLPKLENEFQELTRTLQTFEVQKSNNVLNHWVDLKAEDVFAPSYGEPLSESDIVAILKKLEKATTTNEKNVLIEALKQDVPTVQNFLYRNVSRYRTHFPKYGLTYQPWYRKLMKDFRNIYLPQDSRNKVLYAKKRQAAVTFFQQQQKSIQAQNQWKSFLEQIEHSTIFRPVKTLVETLNKIQHKIATHTKEKNNLTSTDPLYPPLERKIKYLTSQKNEAIQKIQNAFEVFVLIQQNNLEMAQNKWNNLQAQFTQIKLDHEGPESTWWQEQQEAKQFYIQYGKTKQEAFAEWDLVRQNLEEKDAEFTQKYRNDFAVKAQDRLHYVGRKETLLLQSFRNNSYPKKVVKHGYRKGDVGLITWSGDQKHEQLQTELLKYSTWFRDPIAKAKTQNELAKYEQELYTKRENEWEQQYAQTPPPSIDETLLASHIIKRKHTPTTGLTRTIEVPIPSPVSNQKSKSKKSKPKPSQNIISAYNTTENKESFISLASQIILSDLEQEREKLLAQIPIIQEPEKPENIDAYNRLVRDVEQARKKVSELDVILRRTIMRKQDQTSVMKKNESIAQDYYQQWVRNRSNQTIYNKYLTYNKRALEARTLINKIEDLETVQRTKLHNAQDQFNAYQAALGREKTIYGRYQNALTLYNTKKDQQEQERKRIQETLDQMYAQKRSEAERYFHQEEKKKDPNYTDPETVSQNTPTATKNIAVDERLYAFAQEMEAQKSVTFSTTTNTNTPWKNQTWVNDVITKVKAGDPHVFTLDPSTTLEELTTLYKATKKETGLVRVSKEQQNLWAFIRRIQNTYNNFMEQNPFSEEKENIVNSRTYWQQKSRYILRHKDTQWLEAMYTLVISEQVEYEEINWFSVEEKKALQEFFESQLKLGERTQKPTLPLERLQALKFLGGMSVNIHALTANDLKENLDQALNAFVENRKDDYDNIVNKYIQDLNDLLNDGDTDPAELDYMQKFVNSKIAKKAYELDENEFLDYKRVRGRALEKYELHETDLIQDDIGFQSVIYENEHQVIVSFAGTDPTSWKDWLNNAFQGIGLPSKQYQQAKDISKIISKNADKKIIFTGHSLGGGLAALAGAYTKQDTYTYNAAGVNEATLKRHNAYEESYDNIYNIITANDILTEFQTEQDLLPTAIGKQIQEKNNSFLDLIELKKSHPILKITKALVGGFIGIKAHGDF